MRLPARRWLVVAGAALAALIAFVLVWFQPQKLWIDDRVDEPAPLPMAHRDDAPSRPDTTPAAPTTLLRGALASRDHHTAGTVSVLRVDERQVLRLEGLDTSNGPDLFVYLTTNPADGPEGAFDDDYVDLGRLKGNLGDQNYDIPAGTDLDRFSTVVIWCDRFDSAFGAADLSAA